MTPKTPVAARNSRSRRRPTRREEREGRRLFQQPRRLAVVVSLLLFFSLSSSSRDETHRNSFGGIIRFARAKAKLNIKSSGIDMVHASHILCGQNRTLCEDVMEWLEPLAENEAMRPKLEMGFEELARRFSRCPTGKRNGGDLGYFPRGEMTKDFDAIVFSELAAPLHKPVGPHQTSNGFHVIMVHDRHLANAEMREQARIATEEAKKQREESFNRNMKKEQAKQERKGARAQARQERESTHDEF